MFSSTAKLHPSILAHPLKKKDDINKQQPAPCTDDNYIPSPHRTTATPPHTHKTSHQLWQTHTQLTWTCPQLVAVNPRLGGCLQVQQGPEGKQTASGRAHTPVPSTRRNDLCASPGGGRGVGGGENTTTQLGSPPTSCRCGIQPLCRSLPFDFFFCFWRVGIDCTISPTVCEADGPVLKKIVKCKECKEKKNPTRNAAFNTADILMARFSHGLPWLPYVGGRDGALQGHNANPSERHLRCRCYWVSNIETAERTIGFFNAVVQQQRSKQRRRAHDVWLQGFAACYSLQVAVT